MHDPRSKSLCIQLLWALLAVLAGVSGAWAQSPPAAKAPAAPAARPAPAPAQVRRVTYSRGPRYARIVIETSREISYSLQQLPADAQSRLPARIFIDLSGTVRAPELPEQIEGQGILIQRVRVGQFDASTVRVVVDLERAARAQTIALYDPFRIILDVYGKEEAPAPAAVAVEAPLHGPEESGGIGDILSGKTGTAGKGAAAPAPWAAPAAPAKAQKKRGKPQIVLDPGHGGKDPGAIGPKGAREKDVVLEISRRLQGVLEKAGYRVLLTREDDRYLALSERTAFANERTEGGDLFVSIHANSSPTRHANGIETYYWNVAVDRSRVSTVARENFTNLDAVFRYEGSDLQAILSDLQYKEKERSSAALAAFIQKGVMGVVEGLYREARDNGVRHGPLYVLALTDVPAILVEAGFVSNRAEEKRLKNPKYQDALARGILRGIERYLKEQDRLGEP